MAEKYSLELKKCPNCGEMVDVRLVLEKLFKCPFCGLRGKFKPVRKKYKQSKLEEMNA